MLTILAIAEALALFVALPLLALYFKERVKNIARESTDRALTDYKHQYDRELAAINAAHQRQFQEYSLYTRRRHAVYGRLYRRVRIASDAYASMIGLTIRPDFAKYELTDAQEYFERHLVPASAQHPIASAYEAGNRKDAAALLDDLDERVRRHNADKAFAAAKNVEAAYEMYLSDAVRLQMDEVRFAIAAVSVAVDRQLNDERDSQEFEKRQAMESAVRRLFQVMREEIGRITPE